MKQRWDKTDVCRICGSLISRCV